MKSNYTREYIAFRTALANARKWRGLTQQAVADLLDKPQSFVSKYENGERRLDVVEFFQIAHAIRVDPIKILQQTGLL